MIDDHPPYFFATCKGFRYRVYITKYDVLFIELGEVEKQDKANAGAFTAGMMFGLIGALVWAIATKFVQSKPDPTRWKSADEGHELVNCSADYLRAMITSRQRGFRASPYDFDEVCIDYANAKSWGRFLFGESSPALIIDHRSKGKHTFVFRRKADAVIALCELDRLLGNKLDVTLPVGIYKKAIKKYQKSRPKKAPAVADDSLPPEQADFEIVEDGWPTIAGRRLGRSSFA